MPQASSRSTRIVRGVSRREGAARPPGPEIQSLKRLHCSSRGVVASGLGFSAVKGNRAATSRTKPFCRAAPSSRNTRRSLDAERAKAPRRERPQEPKSNSYAATPQCRSLAEKKTSGTPTHNGRPVGARDPPEKEQSLLSNHRQVGRKSQMGAEGWAERTTQSAHTRLARPENTKGCSRSARPTFEELSSSWRPAPFGAICHDHKVLPEFGPIEMTCLALSQYGLQMREPTLCGS